MMVTMCIFINLFQYISCKRKACIQKEFIGYFANIMKILFYNHYYLVTEFFNPIETGDIEELKLVN